MPRRVAYAASGGVHRPYLEVVFCNFLSGRCGPKTFGLIDSGADGIVIPYSLGRQIGLQEPTVRELVNPNIMGGVGGEAWHVHRKCQIHIIDTSSGTTHVFDEQVSWIYPDPHTLAMRTALLKRFEELRGVAGVDAGTQNEILQIEEGIRKIDVGLEVDILLGRAFFDNFKYISFFHQDRSREHECYFEYEINAEKVKAITPVRPKPHA